MTATAFLIILAACAAATSLLTEGVKKLLDGLRIKYAPNILVLIISMIAGCGVTAIYYISCGIPGTLLNIIYLFLMGIANWLGATLGYDKVVQTIAQISRKKNKEED